MTFLRTEFLHARILHAASRRHDDETTTDGMLDNSTVEPAGEDIRWHSHYSQNLRPSSLNFLNASALPFASSTGLWVCAVTRYFFHSVALEASLTRPA